MTTSSPDITLTQAETLTTTHSEMTMGHPEITTTHPEMTMGHPRLASARRPRSLEFLSPYNDEDVIVETLLTPELSGIRQRTWARSPTRTFVRNFP